MTVNVGERGGELTWITEDHYLANPSSYLCGKQSSCLVDDLATLRVASKNEFGVGALGLYAVDLTRPKAFFD